MLKSHLLKDGVGSPNVFLHGFLGKSSDWKELCQWINTAPCIGVDLPGHGESPFTENFFTEFPTFSEKIHLVGYSMGGRLASQYAARFPERIESLTLISSHPGLKTEALKQERLKTDGVWVKKLLELPIDLFLNEWYDQPIFSGFKPDFSKRIDQNRDELARAMIYYSLGKQHYHMPKGKILIGERDLKFQKLFKNYHLIANAGHMVHLENPKEAALALQSREFT